MQDDNWRYVEEYIQNLLGIVQSKLGRESVEFVNHYLNHDEFEMAFEGLFLEIMKLEGIPKIDLTESKKVGELLKLNEESVFDFEFWKKFEIYVEKNSGNFGC